MHFKSYIPKWISYRDLSINTVKVSNDLNKSVNGFYMMVVFWTTLFGARVEPTWFIEPYH